MIEDENTFVVRDIELQRFLESRPHACITAEVWHNHSRAKELFMHMNEISQNSTRFYLATYDKILFLLG